MTFVVLEHCRTGKEQLPSIDVEIVSLSFCVFAALESKAQITMLLACALSTPFSDQFHRITCDSRDVTSGRP